MAIAETDTEVHTPFEQDFEKDVAATQRYFDSSRFAGIIRLYTARQVVEQRGTIPVDHIVAREAAGASTSVCANSLQPARASRRLAPTRRGRR